MTYKDFLNNYYFRRGLAFYIDCIVICFITFIYLFFLDEKGATIECDNFICWNTCRILSFQILFYCIYFLLMEFFLQLTLGKMILGFYVFGKKNKTFFWRILMRTILRLIPLDPVSFLFDKQSKFWHEKITKIYTTRKNT
ncbi:RDD family protein [Flavobacterium sp. CF108]|uniref:RDD family protein n=1 Tax=unclassified Flavobacterium TaxID=196869 RepID=UPI0008BCBF32|nr:MULTISPECIES: RDD family protein [unclassified Flavobacterium]SEO96332.1 RDD family protein [Flavobacterium sp. fv08]SHH81491.1 RDD family protein [Flavobacterium sp. CF108]